MLIALATPVAVFMSLVQAETALDHPLAYWPSELAAAGIGLVIARAVHRRHKLAEFAARAEYEHRALLDGDLAFGVHGQFPPG